MSWIVFICYKEREGAHSYNAPPPCLAIIVPIAGFKMKVDKWKINILFIIILINISYTKFEAKTS